MRSTMTLPSEPRRRPSTLLVMSLTVTAATMLFGSMIVWRLYESVYATPVRPTVPVAETTAAPVNVGIARSPGGPAEWITYAKVFAQLQRDLKRPVVVHYLMSSDQQIEMFRRGKLDVALMSTLAYLDVADEHLAKLVATPKVGESLGDYAVIIVPAKSKARYLEDLSGKRFAVSADLAGVSFTYWLLKEHGLDPVGFFSETPVDVQDVNLTKVANGTADATAVRRSALAMWPAEVFRQIERSPDLGSPPIVVRANLDTATADAIRSSMLQAASRGIIPEGSAVTGFVAATEADYGFARTLDGIDRSAEKSAFGTAHQ